MSVISLFLVVIQKLTDVFDSVLQMKKLRPISINNLLDIVPQVNNVYLSDAGVKSDN